MGIGLHEPSVLEVPDDSRRCADIGSHDRKAERHVLDGFQAALAEHPFVLRERINADVDALQVFDFPFLRPLDDFKVDPGQIILKIANDAQPEFASLAQLAKYFTQQIEVGGRTESAGPADRYFPLVAVRVRRKKLIRVHRR